MGRSTVRDAVAVCDWVACYGMPFTADPQAFRTLGRGWKPGTAGVALPLLLGLGGGKPLIVDFAPLREANREIGD